MTAERCRVERRRVAGTHLKSHAVAKPGVGGGLSFLDTVAIGLSSLISDNTIMFILGIAMWTWEPRLGMLLGFAAGFTEWCNLLFKWWFQAPRPFWHMPGVTTPPSAIEIDFSFPSSHVQTATVIVICLWPMLLPSSSTSRALSRSPATAALLSAVPCAIAWARVKVRASSRLLSGCEPALHPCMGRTSVLGPLAELLADLTLHRLPALSLSYRGRCYVSVFH